MAACAESDRPEGGGEGGGGTFVFGAAGDPGTLDPAFATDGETFRVTRQLFEGLLEAGEGSAQPEPGLAESWEPSEDGLSYTFKLREGVTFHDGTDFNADAVCFNFDRWYNFEGLAQSPAASGYWQDVFGGFASTPDVPNIFKSCSVDDEFTATIELTQVTGRFPAALTLSSFAMQSPAALEEFSADDLGGSADAPGLSEYASDHPTGTGPFKLDNWDLANGEVTLVRYDDYWGDKAGVEKLIFRTIPDGNTRKQELEAGSIDGYDLVAPGDITDLEDGGFNVLTRPAFNVLYLGINQGGAGPTQQFGINPALADVRVRQAIAYAIDKDSIVTSLLPDGAQAAVEFMPDTVSGYADDVEPYSYDPAKAQALLQEAGAVGTTLKFYYPTEVSRPYMPDPGAIFEIISQNLTDAGFTIEPVALVWNPDYLDAVSSGQADIHLLGWTGDYDDAYNFIGTFFDAKAGGISKLDFGGYANEDIFAQFAEADAEPDPDVREGLYQQLNRDIMEFLPGVPISHSPPALVVAENVDGLVPSPLTAENFATVVFTD